MCWQQDELSEQQIRISLVEKKLENKSREADDELAKLQRKLDESALQLKKKEKYVFNCASYVNKMACVNCTM